MSLKALGMFIFGGSMSIGVMKAGFEIDRVLEISDEMPEQNAKHFIHNYSSIPVVIPSKWDNQEYINSLREENYDLMYGNPPCSGLSTINRNASADNETNKYMYKYFETVNSIRPKVFLMENAPTLVSRGREILNFLVSSLGAFYNIVILRDYAGNHGVPMRRQRTLVVGFRKDIFNHLVADIKSEHNIKWAYDAITENIISNCKYNMELVPERSCKELEHLYSIIVPGESIIYTLTKYTTEQMKSMNVPENYIKAVDKLKYKIFNNLRAYEKSPCKIKTQEWAPSLASPVELIHPDENRPFYIREYARLMGYPDDFEFVNDAKVPYVQAIAQGVPVDFVYWIANYIKDALLGINLIELQSDCSIIYKNLCNENNIIEKQFDIKDFIFNSRL